MPPPAMIELLQFRHSPYNEKVRWALDLKRVPHVRRSLLPGPHLRTVRALTGRTTTPVLRAGETVIDGSAAWVADTATDFASFMDPYGY